MRLKAVLLALALGAVTAGGASAEGGPGPGGGQPGPPQGGHPSGPPPPGSQQPAKGAAGNDGAGEHPGAAAEQAFRKQLTALGYTCMRRPVMVRGSLTVIGTDSVTLRSSRPAENGRPAATMDIVANVISTTQIRRVGHTGPATLADLVVTDAVEVQAAVCRTAGSTAATRPTLVARQLRARPARV